MRVEFTKQELELLEHASDACMCESYSNYRCQKCRASAAGFVTSRKAAYNALTSKGLVEHDLYHGLVLTEAGRVMADKPFAVRARASR